MRRWRAALAAILLGQAAPGRAELSEEFAALSARAREGSARIEGKAPAAAPRRSIFRIISWNVQTFGGGLSPAREAAYGELLDGMFSTSRSAKILAVQELANDAGAGKFGALLPGGEERWNRRFEDSKGPQDNGFFTQKGVGAHCEQFLFSRQEANGDWVPDRERVKHPVRASHMHFGDFDFTLLSVHLTFGGGDPAGRERELREILGWLREYLADPANDPDVIIAGDFNLPTRAGRGSLRAPPLEDIVGGFPEFAPERDESGRRVPKRGELIALVDAPTSRRGHEPANNYDHFLITGDVYDEEYVQGSGGPFPAKMLGGIEERHDTRVSDHLPISAGFLYKGDGNDGRPIALDQPARAAAEPSARCWDGPRLLAHGK